MAQLLIMIASAGLALIAVMTSLSATEDRFIYVDHMPEIRGEHKRTLAFDDEDSGQKITQELFAQDFDHAVIETYVLTVACGPSVGRGPDVSRGPDVGPRTYIIALKYPPKKPSNFAVATLHDIYKEVYVEDLTGKVRLYEDVQGQSMLDLSERFKPACQPI